MKLQNLMIHCISLQSKRNERYMKILPYYKNLNIIEEIAIDGNNTNYIKKLEKEMNLKFDNFASFSNKALFLKSVILWKEHLKSNNDCVIIIQDDVIPVKNFLNGFKLVINELTTRFRYLCDDRSYIRKA